MENRFSQIRESLSISGIIVLIAIIIILLLWALIGLADRNSNTQHAQSELLAQRTGMGACRARHLHFIRVEKVPDFTAHSYGAGRRIPDVWQAICLQNGKPHQFRLGLWAAPDDYSR